MTNDSPASIAVCPRCRAMLALPPDATEATGLECPACDERFHWDESVRRLRWARIPAAAAPQNVTPQAVMPQTVTPVASATPAPSVTPIALAGLPTLSWSGPDLAASGVHVWEPPAGVEIEFDNYPASAPAVAHEPVPQPVIEQPLAAKTPTHPAEAATPEVCVDPSSATVPMSPADTVPLEVVRTAPVDERGSMELLDGDRPDDDFTVADDGDDEDRFVAPLAEDRVPDLRSDRPPRRRRSAGVGTLVGIVGGGVGGLLLGGYALLWLRGGAVDVFQMGRWLPNSLLPAAMRSSADELEVIAAVEPSSSGDDVQTRVADVSDESQDADLTPVAVMGDPRAEPGAESKLPNTEETLTDAEGVAAPESPLASERRWPVTPIVGSLTDVRLYSLEEFTEAVVAGESAARRFAAGDLAEPESVRDMGQAYVELCALAERLTLTNPSTFGSALITQQALAKAALRSAAAPSRRGDLAVVASRWLEHVRRKNDGALFVGRVRDLRAVGPWTECQFEVTVGDRRVAVPVLMDKLKHSTGDEAGIAGVIVTNPQQRIAGYEGDAPLIVVAGDTFDPAAVKDEAPAAASGFGDELLSR